MEGDGRASFCHFQGGAENTGGEGLLTKASLAIPISHLDLRSAVNSNEETLVGITRSDCNSVLD